MTTTKMTNRNALTYAIENLPDAPAEVLEKLNKMVEQLDRKNAAPRKQTAHQAENEVVKTAILEGMEDGTGYTVSDLLKAIPELDGKSNQYASALMRALVLAGSVTKYTDKRRTYFKLAEVEGE